MNNIFSILSSLFFSTLLYLPTLAYAGLGCCFSETSGVLNIGIEGIMSLGAFTGCAVAYFFGNPWLAIVMAGLSGLLLSLVHAYFSISLRADQTISGTAINLIGPGIAVVLSYILFNSSDSKPLSVDKKIPILFENIPSSDNGLMMIVKNIFSTYATTYILFILIIISTFIFFKTKFGIRMRACGEHPKACETLGINVIKIRYICVLISGFLSGIGGATISMAVINQYKPISIAGQGFIAMAAVIFGRHKPMGILLGCLLFGFAQGLRACIPANIFSVQILSMLPYIITILVLIISKENSSGPKALGKTYIRGE